MEFRRRLIPIRISYNDSDYTWSIKPQEEGFSSFSFKANHSMMHRFLRRIRAKDNIRGANSHKEVRYNDMINGIINKSNDTIYTWRSRCPNDIQTIRRLMEK